MRWLMLAYDHDTRVVGDMGGYRKVWELAEGLGRLKEDVLVVAPFSCPPVADSAPRAVRVAFVNLPLLRPLTVYVGLFVRGLLAGLRRPTDVLYARNLHAPVAPLLAKALGVPLVVEVNGDSLALHRTWGASRLWLAYLRIVDRMIVRAADHVIPITNGLRDMLRDRYAVPADRMTVIESGTNVSLFRPRDASAVRQELGMEAGKGTVVGFAGTFYEYQGIGTLIRAAPSILAQEPDTRFLIVGDGVMRDVWEADAVRQGVRSAFHFTGQVPYRQVPDYLNAMDIGVCPWTATRGETSPLKLLDYMACGRPVVLSDIPSVHELAVRSGAAMLVSPDDPRALALAIGTLIRDPSARARMGQQGRRFVEREYGWDRQVERLLAVARQVCGATP